MGCTTSLEADDSGLRFMELQNAQVEKFLKAKRQSDKSRVKVLLLGTGESGKSTVLKQMRLLHKGGFTEAERIQYKNVNWADAVGSMQKLIIEARKQGLQLQSEDPASALFPYLQKIVNYDPLEAVDTDAAGGELFLKDFMSRYSEIAAQRRRMKSTGLADSVWEAGDEFEDALEEEEETGELLKDFMDETHGGGVVTDSVRNQTAQKHYTKQEIAEAITKLWKGDKGIRQCFQGANKFQFEGSAPYFFSKAMDYADEKYRCTDADILNGRIKTTGITETDFNVGGMNMAVYDAGGQRSERKKWMHCFQGVTCVLFVFAVSEYDQVLLEDHKVNRVQEALALYQSLRNSPWFANTPFVVFLNKTDLLEDKLKRSPLKKVFNSYQGDPTSVEDALQFFENVFKHFNRSPRGLYFKHTCATDTKSMNFVIDAVRNIIAEESLQKSGIF